MFLCVVGCRLLSIAADFADHDDRLGVGIVIEELKSVDKCRPNDGIPTNADRGRLSDATQGKLVNSFVRERPRAGNNSDIPLLMNAAGHDANLAFSR